MGASLRASAAARPAQSSALLVSSCASSSSRDDATRAQRRELWLRWLRAGEMFSADSRKALLTKHDEPFLAEEEFGRASRCFCSHVKTKSNPHDARPPALVRKSGRCTEALLCCSCPTAATAAAALPAVAAYSLRHQQQQLQQRRAVGCAHAARRRDCSSRCSLPG